jgi:hypothetical protein
MPFLLRNQARAEGSFLVYPQQVLLEPSVAKELRFRYYLRHPYIFQDQHFFMDALTASTDRGIQFTERWQVSRIACMVLIAVASTAVTGGLYAHFKDDVSGAFTISGLFSAVLHCCCLIYTPRIHDWSIVCDWNSHRCFEFD